LVGYNLDRLDGDFVLNFVVIVVAVVDFATAKVAAAAVVVVAAASLTIAVIVDMAVNSFEYKKFVLDLTDQGRQRIGTPLDPSDQILYKKSKDQSAGEDQLPNLCLIDWVDSGSDFEPD
jgi:hypothetical protein